MTPEIAKHSEKLIIFFEVAKEGSLQATARKLGLTAPGLSHSIKELERATGSILFNRRSTGVSLTASGELLMTFCRRFFRDLDDLQQTFANPDRAPIRRFRIGTFQSIALYFWPKVMHSFRQERDLHLSITTNRSRSILESLLRQDIDLALTVEAPEHPKLIRHELYRDHYAFYAPAIWKKSVYSRTDLSEIALLYLPDAVDVDQMSLRQYINGWNLKLRDEFELDSLEVIGEFVKRGYGLGILPTNVAKTHGKSLRRVRLEGVKDSTFGAHRFFLTYRNDLDLPAAILKRFLASAQQAAVELNS